MSCLRENGCVNYNPKLISQEQDDCTNYKPKEQEWDVGDYAYYYAVGNCGICKIVNKLYVGKVKQKVKQIEFLDGGMINISLVSILNGVKHNLRPLIPSDWTREIDGVKYRAYEDEENRLMVFMRNKNREVEDDCEFTDFPFYRSFCRLAQIPVMPYELSKGTFEYPE